MIKLLRLRNQAALPLIEFEHSAEAHETGPSTQIIAFKQA